MEGSGDTSIAMAGNKSLCMIIKPGCLVYVSLILTLISKILHDCIGLWCEGEQAPSDSEGTQRQRQPCSTYTAEMVRVPPTSLTLSLSLSNHFNFLLSHIQLAYEQCTLYVHAHSTSPTSPCYNKWEGLIHEIACQSWSIESMNLSPWKLASYFYYSNIATSPFIC